MTDLSFHVRQYVPTAEGDELVHRETLMKARDWAAAMRGRTHTRAAFDLACQAHEIAGGYVFAEGETPLRLKQAADLCRHLVAAAMLHENLDAEGEL